MDWDLPCHAAIGGDLGKVETSDSNSQSGGRYLQNDIINIHLYSIV
jgi:hypothetical protein